MLVGDMIDKKIQAVLELNNDELDETNVDDCLFYKEMRDFAKDNDGLVYFYGNRTYMVINFIGEEDLYIIPIEYPL